MSALDHPDSLLSDHFGPGPAPQILSVPGRVNLIGEHIDYHDLPVLPMAIQRGIRIAFRPRNDRRIRAASMGFADTEFDWTPQLAPGAAGDWANYLKAAAQAVEGRWRGLHGIDAAIVADLPPAAGLSSSSALLTGVTLALLAANGIHARFEELMDILPDGEQFVGTRGGGMDHAAVLASKPGCALLIRFAPVSVANVPIPPDWGFLVAHSLVVAEKSGAVKAEYNGRRAAGTRALERLGLPSFRKAIEQCGTAKLEALAQERLHGDERGCFLHVVTEGARVEAAAQALRAADAPEFARLLNAAHASVRDDLRISCPALDELAEAALASGALGARLTGAGFGGCAVIFAMRSDLDRIRRGVVDRYYAKRQGFDPAIHLLAAEPSAGALSR